VNCISLAEIMMNFPEFGFGKSFNKDSFSILFKAVQRLTTTVSDVVAVQPFAARPITL
jgi:hypothetical protein